MSKARDWERARRHRLVMERGAAEATPKGPKNLGDHWDTLAANRGWVRPPVKDWRDEVRTPYGQT